MQNTRQYFLSLILAALLVGMAIAWLATPKVPVDGPRVPRVVPQMFALLIMKGNGAEMEILNQGTGILIDHVHGNLSIAKHVASYLDQKPGSVLYARIDGKLYPLDVLWRHERADIAVARFRGAMRPPSLPRAMPVTRTIPGAGEAVKLLGYLWRETESKIRACEVYLKVFVCEKAVPLTLDLPETGMEGISLPSALYELQAYVEFVKEHPETTLTFENFSYGRYAIAAFMADDEGKTFGGMSGGAGVNENNEMFGTFVSYTSKHAVFIPAYEIPDEYLPHPLR